LFGTERIDLAPLRHPLLDLQNGACFYCGQRVKRAAHVDHFIPWSRYPDDGLDNLVVADSTCNSRKTDFLASERHVGSCGTWASCTRESRHCGWTWTSSTTSSAASP